MENSLIAAELERRLKETATGENRCAGSLVFDAGFPGFEGHFENFPLVPGICYLRTAELMLGRRLHRRFVLETVSRMKFRRPTRPGEKVDFELEFTRTEAGRVDCSCSAKCGGELACQIQMSGGVR